MPFLFHQNMENFGGGAPATNAAYQAAFGGIAAALPGPIVVAGFTEVTNNGAANTALSGVNAAPGINLCGALGVTFRCSIICRRTAVGNRYEYIGIGTNSNPFTPIMGAGRILVRVRGGVELIHDIAPMDGGFQYWCSHFPLRAAADYQGLVYVVVPINGVTVAVAYGHNIFSINDNRPAMTQNFPHAANLMRANPAMPGPNGVVYVCGDFNCAPIVRQRHDTVMQFYAQGSLPLGGQPAQFALNAAQAAANGQAGGTTMAGNLYDYSFSTLQLNGAPIQGLMVPPVPGIDTRTMNVFPGGANTMSDHVASILHV